MGKNINICVQFMFLSLLIYLNTVTSSTSAERKQENANQVILTSYTMTTSALKIY